MCAPTSIESLLKIRILRFQVNPLSLSGPAICWSAVAGHRFLGWRLDATVSRRSQGPRQAASCSKALSSQRTPKKAIPQFTNICFSPHFSGKITSESSEIINPATIIAPPSRLRPPMISLPKTCAKAAENSGSSEKMMAARVGVVCL